MITSAGAKKLLAQRQKLSQTTQLFSLEDHLFPQQLAFVLDPSPNKVAVCSRRSGKTTACAADLVKAAIDNPGVICLYITLSRNNAKKIIWKEIKKLNRTYGLKGVANESELSITYPNESTIYLSGAKDTSEIEKFRGLALKLVYIDECQSFRQYLKDLIDDVLSPALMDHSGTLCLIGTPGAVPVGYFHDCAVKSSNDSWSKHGWTFWDNNFILGKSKKTHQEMLDRELKRRGVPISDPSIQREWFGRWVLDDNSLLLHYNQTINHYDALPRLNWNYLMGVDLGFNDADAIAVLAWSEETPVTYLVHEQTTRQQGITELVEQIQAVSKKYDVSKIVIDEGGLGKKIAEEIRRQKHIPVQGADKKLKMQNVAFLNDAMRTGRFQARSNGVFAQDCFLVEKDIDKTTPDKIVVSNKYHSDIIDAVLYAFKESPAFAYQPAKPKPKYGTKEWAAQQQDEMWEAAVEHHEAQAELEQRLREQYE